MDNETLITLAADIVGAHVSNNSVAMADVPGLIQTVFGSLQSAIHPSAPVEERPEPAVSVRASVKPDAITCLECGAKFKMLKRHLTADHGTTPAQYRERWNLNSDYPMVASNYSATRKELALKIGLGRKPATAVKATKPRKPRLQKTETAGQPADG
jgi:predicted transcriptional regulator